MSFTKFPKNLASIKNTDAFRNYCLNPLGLQASTNHQFPKEKRVYDYLNIPLTIHRGEKPVGKNTIVFKVQPRLTKPEIKQYLEKVYELEVKKVHTAIFMGKIRRGGLGKRYREADYKKAMVVLKTPVEEFYQKVETPK